MRSDAPLVQAAQPDSWEVRDLKLSLSQLKANFDEVALERDEAREVAKDALEVVKVLARTFGAPELTGIKRRDPRRLDGWGVHDYGNFALTTISAMRQRLIAENRSLREQLEEVTDASGAKALRRLETLETRLAETSEERDEARAALKEAEAQNAQLKSRLGTAKGREEKLREDLAAARERVQTLHREARRLAPKEEGEEETGSQPPTTKAAVANGGLTESKLKLLRVLAFEGMCRRPEIEAMLNSEHGIPVGGTMGRLFNRLEERGLIEQARPKSEIGAGPPPMLVWLTRKGIGKCQESFGIEPLEQEGARLRARHKSTEHAYLNLVAGDILREAGYEVDLFPDPIQAGDYLVDPDILATKDERIIIVECERYTRKDRDHRARKWNGLAQASQLLSGTKDLYVLTPNKEAKNAIISELSQWRGEWRDTSRGTEVHVSSAHEVLVQGKGLWSYERQF